MTLPVALFIKKTNEGYDFIIRNLNDNSDYSINMEPIKSITKAFEQFDKVVKAAKENNQYDVQYVSEDII